MLNFKQRLMRYLAGVAIGLLLVYAFFGSRNWLGWTPGNRVLELLRESKMKMSGDAKCQLECIGLGVEDVLHLLSRGEVLFSESQTKTSNRTYVVLERDMAVRMTFESQDSSATLVHVAKEGFICSCD